MDNSYLCRVLEGLDRLAEGLAELWELRGAEGDRGHHTNHEQFGTAEAEETHRRDLQGARRGDEGVGWEVAFSYNWRASLAPWGSRGS